MLDIKILKVDYAVSYGSVTLKSLQNDRVPELDLLVREAIQNSSDASLSQPGTSYKVGFNTGTFIPTDLNAFMTGVDGFLNSRFPDETADFLEIRDTGTSGLSGCIRKAEIKEDHGNFFKLIYDTGKRQTQAHAGGNWGFGKSVYYRVGIGMVIFYSKTDIERESRLIITLVEDESKKNDDGSDATILNSLEPLSAGKAWWGISEGDDLLPLRDDELIIPILNVFGLKPFGENETGTSIIIPYINQNKLLSDVIPEGAEIRDDVRENFSRTYTTSLNDYLRLAIQKWYSPKIHNRELEKYGIKWLLVSINNVPLRKHEMLPFFKLVQELYLVSLAKTLGKDYKSDLFDEIECQPVNVMHYFDSKISGYVSIAKVTSDEIKGTDVSFSPYDYVGRFEADGGLNEPIVMYARDPGMVIEYPIAGPWVKNISPPASENEFIFAFYVPITRKILKGDLQVPEYAGMTLGEYLRSCEASDHMGWNDPAKMKLVDRIQKNTIGRINAKMNVSDMSKIEATASKLSGKLGRKLLPKVGYGKMQGGSSGNGAGGGGGGGKLQNMDLSIESSIINGSDLELRYKLKLLHSKKDATISITIASESGWIDADSWQNDIGTRFPAQILSFSVEHLSSGMSGEGLDTQILCSATNLHYEDDTIEIFLSAAAGSCELTTVKLYAKVFNLNLCGKLVIHARDKKYRFSYKAE